MIDKTSDAGKNNSIGNSVVIAQFTKLGSGIKIGAGASLSRITIGNNTQIETGVLCTGFGDGKITIGNESYIGIRNILDWSDDITIGNFVHIAGSSTCLWTHTSYKQAITGAALSDKSERLVGPIVIQDKVYIGGNCTIYPNVTIGHNSVILPNSVITKNVEPFSMMGGVPARFIKKTN